MAGSFESGPSYVPLTNAELAAFEADPDYREIFDKLDKDIADLIAERIRSGNAPSLNELREMIVDATA